MPEKKSKTSFVRSKYDEIGVYVWEMPDGRYLANENKDFLSISARFGDLDRMSRLAATARSYGINEGKPAFLPGHRKIDDEEYERQIDRMNNGMIPDDHDLAAYEEEFEAKHKNGG